MIKNILLTAVFLNLFNLHSMNIEDFYINNDNIINNDDIFNKEDFYINNNDIFNKKEEIKNKPFHFDINNGDFNEKKENKNKSFPFNFEELSNIKTEESILSNNNKSSFDDSNDEAIEQEVEKDNKISLKEQKSEILKKFKEYLESYHNDINHKCYHKLSWYTKKFIETNCEINGNDIIKYKFIRYIIENNKKYFINIINKFQNNLVTEKIIRRKISFENNYLKNIINSFKAKKERRSKKISLFASIKYIIKNNNLLEAFREQMKEDKFNIKMEKRNEKEIKGIENYTELMGEITTSEDKRLLEYIKYSLFYIKGSEFLEKKYFQEFLKKKSKSGISNNEFYEKLLGYYKEKNININIYILLDIDGFMYL